MPQGDEPKSEPEIIPPGRTTGYEHRTRTFTGAHGTERVYVARIGPVGTILIVLITAILIAVMLMLLLGVLLIWLPLIVLFAAGAIIVAVVRAYLRRSS